MGYAADDGPRAHDVPAGVPVFPKNIQRCVRDSRIEFNYLESHLHQLDDAQLESLANCTTITLEQWKQFRVHVNRRQGGDADLASDAGSDAGDLGEGEELANLKKRAAEQGLDATQAQRYQALATAIVENRAAKRTRRSEAQTCEMYRAFCAAAANNL
eukprot:3989687-Pyramimonas_sp.AAC.1